MKKATFLAGLLLFCQAWAFAQSAKDSDIVLIRERKYKLVEMPNGDKVPFVNVGADNTDIHFKDGKVSRKIYFNLFLKQDGHKDYIYYGDSAMVTREYNEEEKLMEMDSVLFRDKEAVELFHQEFRYNGPTLSHTVFYTGDSLQQETTFSRKGVTESYGRVIKLDSVTEVSIRYDLPEKDTTYDTLTTYRYPDGFSRLTTFRSGEKLNYTAVEVGTNERGHTISVMWFYNQDSVGDHIESLLRHIQYKNDKPPVLNKKFFVGYWVMMNGMRYWQFLPDGRVRMTRLARTRVDERSWGWDEVRRQVYIVVTKEDKEDMGDLDVVGNRLYLKYDAVNQFLMYGDNEYQKRPVLKRPKRDEARVKKMLAGG